MNGRPDKKETDVLLKVLTAHFKALAAAGSDEAVLKEYGALLRFLKSRDANFLESRERAKRRTDLHQRSPKITDEQLREASLDDLDTIIRDEATARCDLEFIAIQRFSVPRGSMRSFSNKQMLIEKLRALISNERAHETIGAVARGRTKQTVGS